MKKHKRIIDKVLVFIQGLSAIVILCCGAAVPESFNSAFIGIIVAAIAFAVAYKLEKRWYPEEFDYEDD